MPGRRRAEELLLLQLCLSAFFSAPQRLDLAAVALFIWQQFMTNGVSYLSPSPSLSLSPSPAVRFQLACSKAPNHSRTGERACCSRPSQRERERRLRPDDDDGDDVQMRPKPSKWRVISHTPRLGMFSRPSSPYCHFSAGPPLSSCKTNWTEGLPDFFND